MKNLQDKSEPVQKILELMSLRSNNDIKSVDFLLMLSLVNLMEIVSVLHHISKKDSMDAEISVRDNLEAKTTDVGNDIISLSNINLNDIIKQLSSSNVNISHLANLLNLHKGNMGNSAILVNLLSQLLPLSKQVVEKNVSKKEIQDVNDKQHLIQDKHGNDVDVKSSKLKKSEKTNKALKWDPRLG